MPIIAGRPTTDTSTIYIRSSFATLESFSLCYGHISICLVKHIHIFRQFQHQAMAQLTAQLGLGPLIKYQPPFMTDFAYRTAASSLLKEHTPCRPLGAFKDACQIARLVQCPQCSCTLQEPVTLPCGNTLCKRCIPLPLLRTNISYLSTGSRLYGFQCPFDRCRAEHV